MDLSFEKKKRLFRKLHDTLKSLQISIAQVNLVLRVDSNPLGKNTIF